MRNKKEESGTGFRKLNKFIEFKVKEESELFDFLMKAFAGISRSSVKSMLTNKRVLVDQKIESRHDVRLKPGMVVSVSRGKVFQPSGNRFFRVLYEDAHIIVVDKNPGILTIGTPTEKVRTLHAYLNDYVQKSRPNSRVYIVHRLDRDTSGLLVFAKDEKTKKKLQDNWRTIVKDRRYVAVVSGVMEKNAGTVTSWLQENKMFVTYSSPLKDNGEKAVTHFKVVKRCKNYTMVDVKLETGRKNQIRVHMQDLGHPVIGDEKYGNGDNPLHRLGLHAYRLSFFHPVTGRFMDFNIPYPKGFNELFENRKQTVGELKGKLVEADVPSDAVEAETK